MTRKEKIVKLREIADQLKKEFVGLDSIIDEIIKSIYPWYVTPEIIERPVITFLAGMTGVGKTSVVKRLVELLGMRSLILDMGENAGGDTSYNLTETIGNFISGGDHDDNNIDRIKEDQPGPIFLFDEFQYANTLDPTSGNEINKVSLRPIWSMLDSGVVEIEEYVWGQSIFKSFVTELTDFCQRYGNTKVEHCILSDPDVVKEYVDVLGFFFYERDSMKGKMGNTSRKYPHQFNEKDDEDEENDPYAPINVMALSTGNIPGLVMRKMNSYKSGEGKVTLEKIYNAKTLGEICEILNEVSKIISAPKKLDCHKALIFVIGNLDEAFKVEENVSCDIDANTFSDLTNNVSIHDLKSALLKRYRAEQVARLGNNLIKYPTLREEHFIQIIKKELTRITSKYEEIEGVKINYGKDIIELAYSEGVYPCQGVRPVFSTIGTLFTPLLSDISIDLEGEKEVTLSVKSDYPESLGFKVPEIKIVVDYGKGKTKEIPIKLTLGNDRYPKNRVRRFSTSVHEVGHAILSSYVAGIIPSKIVSVSTNDGGFCETYDKKLQREIPSVEDVKSDILISMAGYKAEELVFGKHNPDSILIGSGSDINRAWESLNDAVYNKGLLNFASYSFPATQPKADNYPNGFTTDIEGKIKEIWDELERKVEEILKQESNLLKNGALLLTQVGCIGKKEFSELIEKYGNKLTLDHIEKMKNKEDWYRQMLEKFE